MDGRSDGRQVGVESAGGQLDAASTGRWFGGHHRGRVVAGTSGGERWCSLRVGGPSPTHSHSLYRSATWPSANAPALDLPAPRRNDGQHAQ
jgi:hypothetical protein